MAAYLRSLLMLIISSVALASCSPEKAIPPATRTGAAAALTTAPSVDSSARAAASPLPSLAASVASPATMPYAEETARTTPLRSHGALVASLGDPVDIGRGGIRDAAFSPDHKTLAIGWTNGVSLVRVEDQLDFWYWEAPEMLIAVDTSAEHVAVLLANGDVWLLNVDSGASQGFEAVARIPGSEACWGDVAWSPDGRLAAIQAIGLDDTGTTPILLLDPASGEITELQGSHTNPGMVPYLVWSPDSRMIASADPERRGWVLDVTSGEVVFEADLDDQGRSPRIYGWLPDSTVVIYGSGGGNSLRLEEVATGEVVSELIGTDAGFTPTPPVVISPNGDLALVGGHSLQEYEIHPYQVWDLNLGRPLDVPPVGELRHINSAGCMELDRPAVAFDGEEVVYLDTDGRLVRWKVGEEQGDVLGWIPVRYPCLETPMVWSNDSSHLVLETDPGKAITVWDVTAGELITERRDGTYPADLHGEVLAYRDGDGNLVLWNIKGNVEIDRLPGPVTSFTSGVEFSPDGSQVAYGVGNLLHIADLASREMVAALNTYPEGQQISHILWAPSGDALTAASGSTRGMHGPPGILILWEKVGDAFIEAIRTETVQASDERPWVNLSQFSPSSRHVALERMREPVAGQEAVLVYDRESRAVVLEKQDYLMHQWVSDDTLLLSTGCSLVEVNVNTGKEIQVRDEGCQAELGAFAPDGVHFSDIVFSGRSVDMLNWHTAQVEATRFVGSEPQDGVFSPDGRWLLVRMLQGLVRTYPVSYSEVGNH